ncbi:Npun_F0494 family protein [Roseofilum capinflatum]|uniref:MarR family transcriptional regulator n=1 Tax=Roseofilum capinflatum BLCC-M114 TaxID=3022440 RepID=A0ABT7B1R8_9CYAN|nr:Npun_F0494 family protein [Roseofilum capinflatum]MDJ1172491.1 hypothetical protein [Roseofilum capinflatum BLCC-M114]
MSSVHSSPLSQPDRLTWTRADLALRCSPFQLQLFIDLKSRSIPLAAIASQAGFTAHYTHTPLTEIAAEDALLWLIQVGILRREVDGQGITDRFRLTPLGRQLIEHWEQQTGTLPTPSIGDRLYNRFHQLIPWFLR